MKGPEIMRAIDERRTDETRFVRWWRKENDFLDFDLLDRFVANGLVDEEIGGIDLLTMDEMWGILQKVGGDRIRQFHDRTGDKVEWTHGGKNGTRSDVCAFTPETLITIFDAETHGNPVDS